MSGSQPPETPSSFADGVRLAIGTLSVFPVRPGIVDRRAGGIAMAVAPMVGAAIGICGGLVLAVAMWLGTTPLLASVLAVATVALLTRGLHLDGLADLADGLGSGRPAERALEIMKRSDIGPFGVVTLLFTVLAQVAALAELTATGAGPIAMVTACTAGRLALTWACRTGVPAARADGLGRMVAGTVRRGVAAIVTALVLALTALLALPDRDTVFGPWLSDSFVRSLLLGWLEDGYRMTREIAVSSAAEAPGPVSTMLLPWTGVPQAVWGLPAAVLAGLLAAWMVRRRAVRRLGGVTGDVLGAVVEIATAMTLLACAVLVG
ncbi:adenosylcobinamide-GDP ribazoletransferase [Streptosporangium becharense]|uniref:Adenosylcobinamide-GDP ribazoletransferase n=1 Tax=Streptosporangium becharense TaxID=1816182 RepID=A0A7W9ID44_9ACTN|nr:adenosylcobinamide-GDP ribazoletransferase [Streptosporangium becharense]MBB2911915.1 adenosylcobinamide-GDP ribazoletransferase [Streptosporangium becharense]MBB5818462.1 adenosylcobinamide-GDP ribazoletransferase [Streptosporangium becharense]